MGREQNARIQETKIVGRKGLLMWSVLEFRGDNAEARIWHDKILCLTMMLIM